MADAKEDVIATANSNLFLPTLDGGGESQPTRVCSATDPPSHAVRVTVEIARRESDASAPETKETSSDTDTSDMSRGGTLVKQSKPVRTEPSREDGEVSTLDATADLAQSQHEGAPCHVSASATIAGPPVHQCCELRLELGLDVDPSLRIEAPSEPPDGPDAEEVVCAAGTAICENADIAAGTLDSGQGSVVTSLGQSGARSAPEASVAPGELAAPEKFLTLQILDGGPERRLEVRLRGGATVADLKAQHFGEDIARGARLHCIFLGRPLHESELISQLPNGSFLHCYLQRPQVTDHSTRSSRRRHNRLSLERSAWQDVLFHSLIALGFAVAWSAYVYYPDCFDVFSWFCLWLMSFLWPVVGSADVFRTAVNEETSNSL